jgi:hypothetical protein
VKYRGANIRLLKAPDYRDVRAVLSAMRAHGANAIALNTYLYCYLQPGTTDIAYSPFEPSRLIYADQGQDPSFPWADTIATRRVRTVAQMALDMSFERVVLKPMLDSRYGQWRGAITVPTELRRAFMRDYKRYVLEPYLPVVRDLGLDLCIGTEMVKVTEHLGAEFWIEIVRWLRSRGVTGRLTYAANWGWEADAEFNRLRELWPHLDYIGVDAYWPMVEADYRGPITKELLMTSTEIGWHRVPPWGRWWCPPPFAYMSGLKAATGKPVWFTEIGYPNNMTAAIDPAGDTPAEEYTTELSGMLWEAARQTWEQHLEGWLSWEAGRGSVVATSHNILNTPLGDIAWGAD